MSYNLITVSEHYQGEITEICLGKAPANILCMQAMNEISDCLTQLDHDRNKKCVIFSGEGKHFSFGASVDEHRPGAVNDMLPKFHQFIGLILEYKIPIIAKVSGLCLGGGFELALACNFIFANEHAKFAVPEIQLSVFPPVASVLLPFRCGDQISSEFILTGEQIKAADMKNLGLINNIFDQDSFDLGVNQFIEKNILPKSASSLRFANHAARMMIQDIYNKYISKLEDLYLNELMKTEDAKEGIVAFLEKRKPDFSKFPRRP